VADLLRRLAAQGVAQDYISYVLAELEQHPLESTSSEPPPAVAPPPRSTQQVPAEPAVGRSGLSDLTNRELDVLELLAQRLRDKEIAARLSVSTHTVKSHVKSIFQKLQVSDRRQAVVRAHELGLLPPPNR
jgi:LuxR family maltose regulon positive regulatory protein